MTMPDASTIVPTLTEAVREMGDASRKLLAGASAMADVSARDIEIGTTPKDLVWKRDKVSLYRYRPIAERRVAQPLLIAFSVVGRYTIIDLQEDRSVVRALLEKGIDVYAIDWGSASRADRWLTVGDYVNDYLGGALAAIRSREGGGKVNLLGICEGGTFSACCAALHPKTLQNLILVVTPINFHGQDPNDPPGHGYLNLWVRNIPPEEIDRLVDVYGFMPGELMGQAFQSLTPMRTMLKYNLDLMEIAGDKKKLSDFYCMEKWIADRPPHPGELVKQWVKDFYQGNKLYENTLELDGQRVDLKNVTMPVLSLYATADHIVPPAQTRGVGHLFGTSDYTEKPVKAGHMGILVSAKAPGQVSGLVYDWLSERQS